MRLRLLTLSLFAPFLTVQPALAAPITHVVELFTSQSCSSCPPAEEVLNEFAKRPDVLALAFHVDYWNHLSWRDTFSSPAWTARQRAYAKHFGRWQVYTPQMVVDGRSEFNGADNARADRELAGPVLAAAQIEITRRDGHADVKISADAPSGEAGLVLLGLGDTTSVDVADGENGGRRLINPNPVVFAKPLGRFTGGSASYSVALPENRPLQRLVVLLQSDQDGRILSAAGE